MEGLVAEEDELTAEAKVLSAEKNDNGNDDRQADGSLYRTTKQRVTVVNGQETNVTLVLRRVSKAGKRF